MKLFRLVAATCAVWAAGAILSLAQDPERENSPASVTFGGQAGEERVEFFGDLLLPAKVTRSGLWFVNPRALHADEGEEEANLGVGYRHLLNDVLGKDYLDVILGANLYYDSRWTRYDNHFHQAGFGVELLSEWVDARANYYLPENDQGVAGTRRETDVDVDYRVKDYWRDPYAVDHRIVQGGTHVEQTIITTTTRVFEQFEQAREGWDAEIGVKLPGLDKWAQVKVFGGYYHWDGEYVGSPDLEGPKARLEVRAGPALYLDAAVFEDEELNGSDWMAGGRLTLPFDTKRLAQKKNPFVGAFAKKAEPKLADRLLDMVMRDLHVRSETSSWEENVGARQVQVETHTKKRKLRDTLMRDIIFVDDDRGDDANPGTTEEPKRTIQNGVDSAFGRRNVYVYRGNYVENVVLDNADSDIQIYGEGCPIRGHGGKKFGGKHYPVVNGTTPAGIMPSFRLLDADNVRLQGFEITHSGGMAAAVPDGVFGTYTINFVGLEAENADNLYLRCNRLRNNSYGALILADASDGTEDYFVRLRSNAVYDNVEEDGVRLDAVGGSGLFWLESRGNSYRGNAHDGLSVAAANFDAVSLLCESEQANDNGGDGFNFEGVDANESGIFLVMRDIQAHRNGDCGIDADFLDNPAAGVFLGLFDGIRASDNGDAGLDLFVTVDGTAAALLADGRFNNNGDEGVDWNLESQGFTFAVVGPDGAFFEATESFLPFLDTGIRGPGLVVANGNGADGIALDLGGVNAAVAALFDVRANGNGVSGSGDGIDVYCEASDGVAAALFIPSAPLLGLAQGGLNLAAELLGVPAVRLPRARYHGPIQALQNRDAGIRVALQGFGAAFGGIFDVIANNNGGPGIDASAVSDDGPAGLGIFSSDLLFALGEDADPVIAQLLGLGDQEVLQLPSHRELGPVEAIGNGLGGVRANVNGYDSALAAVAGVLASGNLGNGINADLASDNGGGLFACAYVQADGNANRGIDVQADTLMDAVAAFWSVDASFNGNDGIRARLIANDPDAEINLLLAGVSAMWNANRGVMADLLAEGRINVGLTDVNASGNQGGPGIRLVATSLGDAISVYGAADALLTAFPWPTELLPWVPQGPIVANNNAGAGLSVDLWANETLWVVLSDVVAANNAGRGINVVGTAFAPTDFSQFTFDNVLANNNGAHGVRAELSTFGTDHIAAMLFQGVQANGNSEDGIHAVLDSDAGPAAATFSNVVANANVGDGISVSAEAGDGRAGAHFRWASTRNNGNVGVRTRLSALGATGVAEFYGERIVSVGNNVGVRVNADAASGNYALDMGEGVMSSPGLCSIYGNVSRDVRNAGGGVLRARSNWWGQSPPDPAQFAGTVDYTPWLAFDPNP